MDGSMVLRAHWRHLVNTIELVLLSAHPSLHSKRQIDRSPVLAQLTAEEISCTYNGFFLPPKLPLPNPMGIIWIPSNTWFPGPILNQHLDRFSRFAGFTSVTERLADRPTDHVTRSVTITVW